MLFQYNTQTLLTKTFWLFFSPQSEYQSNLCLLVVDIGKVALTAVVAAEVVGHEGVTATASVGPFLEEVGNLASGAANPIGMHNDEPYFFGLGVGYLLAPPLKGSIRCNIDSC